MSYLIVHHTVEDYARWKPFFDSHAVVRKASGSLGGQVLRGADNPNEVVIIFKWDTVENAQEFAHSPALREVMQQAGVMGRPDIYFLEEAEQVPA